MKALNNVIKYLIVWDGIWSVPTFFGLYVLSDIGGQYFFGDSWATYDPSIFQAALIVGGIGVFFNLLSTGALFFNFRELFTYGNSDKYQTDIDTLTAWQRILLVKGTFFLYFLFFVILFIAIRTAFVVVS